MVAVTLGLDLFFPHEPREACMKDALHRFRRKHLDKRRVIRAVMVSTPTILLGVFLLRFDVQQLGLDPVWAYRANWPIITALCFILNLVFVFDDRENLRGTVIKWFLVSAVHSVFTQYLYPKLVHAGVHYLMANAILLLAGPVSYLIQSMFTFRKEKSNNQA